jgi:hypothetical protein
LGVFDGYEVQTQVPGTIVQAFVKIVEGEPITIYKERCEEFRFEALANRCATFTRLPPPGVERPTEATIDTLAKPLSAVEEKWVVLERAHVMVTDALRSVCDQIASLESEVRQLSEVGPEHPGFEAEQAYRRGCEFCGFLVQEVAKRLDLSLLKRSADLGNSDGQYRCGQCLLEGDRCEKNPELRVESREFVGRSTVREMSAKGIGS